MPRAEPRSSMVPDSGVTAWGSEFHGQGGARVEVVEGIDTGPVSNVGDSHLLVDDGPAEVVGSRGLML